MIDFIQIADAVVIVLKSGSFCLTPTIQRVILPMLTEEEIKNKTLKISVVPNDLDSEKATRTQDTNEYKIHVGIQQKVDDIDVEVPAILLFVKEVLNFIKRKNLPTKPPAHYVSLQNKPIYDPKQLAESKVFTTLITITYSALD